MEDLGGSALSQAVLEAHNDERPFADEVRLPSSHTETVGAVSDVSAHALTGEPDVVAPVEEVTVSLALRDAFRFLDFVDVSNIFQRQASVMRFSPKFICGAFRSAVRVALQEIVRVGCRICNMGFEFDILSNQKMFKPVETLTNMR